MIGQIKEESEAKEERMQKYLKLTKHLTQEFDKVEFVQIPRSQNMVADEVVKLASSEEGVASMGLRMEVQKRLSIKEISTFANGQTEVMNRTLLKIIKAKLDDAKGVWPEEFPSVLWAYKTTARTPTRETPFRLAYDTEAVILR